MTTRERCQKKTLSDMITTYAFAELWTNFVLSQHVLINFIGHVVDVVVGVWCVGLCRIFVLFALLCLCCLLATKGYEHQKTKILLAC